MVYFLNSVFPNTLSKTPEISISSADFKYTTFRETFAHLKTFSSSILNSYTQ